MPTQLRFYSSTAAKTTLAASISSSATSLTLAAASNLPSSYPYTLILEKDTANEEVVEVTSLVGSAYQITRNIDASGAKAHAFGANVEHGVSARDFTESRQHEVATTSVHGITGDVVGTGGAQTLTSKTLTTATLGSILDAGGYKITNVATPTASSDAVRKDFADAQVTAAATSASSASTSASSAATSAASAVVSASSAGTSATAAAASAATASTSAATAVSSAATAVTSAATAITSAATATTSAAQAATSASSASTSASSAATSAASAVTSATSAAASATTAAASVATIASSASAAATSATSAAVSAASAVVSASSAATSASSSAASYALVVDTTGAGLIRDMGTIADPDTTTGTYISITTLTNTATASAAQATTSASSAATSAASAATSATSAAASATAAAASAATAVTSAATAVTSAATAVTSAATATTSAATAVTSAGQAATSAASSLASQTAAATSATSAAASATAAATSATSAAASATSAAASYDSFDDRYLGPKASAPSVDNDGDALLTGALYFDTTTPGMYVWTGSAWTVMATSGDIESVTAGTGLSGGGTAGAVTVSLNTSSVYVIPSQAGSNGYFLTTNGSAASWANLSDWGAL